MISNRVRVSSDLQLARVYARAGSVFRLNHFHLFTSDMFSAAAMNLLCA